jgi:hypothetical protein
VAYGQVLWWERCDDFLAVGMSESLLIFTITEIDASQTGTDKPLTAKNRVDSTQQLASRVRFNNVTLGSHSKGCLHDIARAFLAHEEHFRSWAALANLPGDFYAIQLGKSDVKQNHARL